MLEAVIEGVEIASSPADRDPHVSVYDLSKTYDLKGDQVEAIRSISFDVERGGFLSIVGPSGCGKSTLLMMIAGLVPITAGTIKIDNSAVEGPRRETSLIFQSPILFPWRTVISNVMFPIEILKQNRQRYQVEAAKLLDLTGLHEFKDRLPEHLSGGMAQRVSLCRALITDPRLLLMDEPFSALDALTRDDMTLELQRIWDRFRKTVIFVTHSIREAVFLSDRVIVLSPRPATVVCDLEITLPRPRNLDMQETAELNRYCGMIRASLGR
ncbi:MAG TPA: ABC transporter ATP-binding protein [Xanthobacteraceae bacterium]